MLEQWTTKNKASELLGLQAKFDVMQSQLQALVTENKQIKEKLKTSTNKPEGAPKPEENETRTVDGQTWLYCKHCFIGRRWNKTHKSAEHNGVLAKTKEKKNKTQPISLNMI
jgi:hypothetical protein